MTVSRPSPAESSWMRIILGSVQSAGELILTATNPLKFKGIKK